MKIAKYLGGFIVILKLLAKLLQWRVVKISWDLPGKPLLWSKLKVVTEDKKITSSEIKMMLEELKKETPDWANQAIDILIWIIDVVKPIDWDISGKYEIFWKPFVNDVEDGHLDEVEIGNILETVLNW